MASTHTIPVRSQETKPVLSAINTARVPIVARIHSAPKEPNTSSAINDALFIDLPLFIRSPYCLFLAVAAHQFSPHKPKFKMGNTISTIRSALSMMGSVVSALANTLTTIGTALSMMGSALSFLGIALGSTDDNVPT